MALFILFADMDLANKEESEVKISVHRIMENLKYQAIFESWAMSISNGILKVSWRPKFPATEFKAKYLISSLNPSEAAIVEVMMS